MSGELPQAGHVLAWLRGLGVLSCPSVPPGLLQDKRMDMDKHGLGVGDYSRVVGKGPGARPQIPKESSIDRGPYFDKVSGHLPGHC